MLALVALFEFSPSTSFCNGVWAWRKFPLVLSKKNWRLGWGWGWVCGLGGLGVICAFHTPYSISLSFGRKEKGRVMGFFNGQVTGLF